MNDDRPDAAGEHRGQHEEDAVTQIFFALQEEYRANQKHRDHPDHVIRFDHCSEHHGARSTKGEGQLIVYEIAKLTVERNQRKHHARIDAVDKGTADDRRCAQREQNRCKNGDAAVADQLIRDQDKEQIAHAEKCRIEDLFDHQRLQLCEQACEADDHFAEKCKSQLEGIIAEIPRLFKRTVIALCESECGVCDHAGILCR